MTGIRTLELVNTGPFEYYSMGPVGQVSIVSSRNGEGKTTIKETLMGVLDRYNSKIVRNGCDTAEVVIEVEIPEGILKARQIVKRGSVTYKIEPPEGLAIMTTEKQYLQSLVDAAFLDPMRYFVNGTDQERLKYLLEMHPIAVGRDELLPILDDRTPNVEVLNLDHLDQVIKIQEDRRKEAKSVRDSQNGLLTELKKTVKPAPKDAPDWRSKANGLRSELSKNKTLLVTLRQNAEAKFSRTVEQIEAHKNARVLELGHQEAEEIRLVKERYAQLRNDEESEARNRIAEEQTRQVREHTAEVAGMEDAIAALESDLILADERAKEHDRDEANRNAVKLAEQSFRKVSQHATREETIVKQLRELRASKLNDIGIEGVDIRDGVVYVNGANYGQQLNKAERVVVAVEVSARAQEKKGLPIKLVVLDDAESLDYDAVDYVVEGCRSLGVQLILIRVDPLYPQLKVESYEEWRAKRPLLAEVA